MKINEKVICVIDRDSLRTELYKVVFWDEEEDVFTDYSMPAMKKNMIENAAELKKDYRNEKFPAYNVCLS